MTLTQVIIYKENATYWELKQLADLLKSDNIKNNGKIVVRCEVEADIKEIRSRIKAIFNVGFKAINCVYMN